MFLCRQRLFLVGPPSEIFGAKKGGAAFLFVLRAYGCRSTCWSRKRRIFRRLEFLFVFFEKKNVPNPMSKLMQPSPAYPIPSLMSSPRSSLRPPTPHHTTNIHQPPTFSILQYPSVPPAHPSCAHKVQEHEAQLEQCKATGKAEKDAIKGIKDLQ